MSNARVSRDTWLFWIVALMVLGAGLGLRDPWPADEPRFALVAKHMIDSGDWLFPHRGNELYSDKPPLFMWLQALIYSLIGNWRVAFLLPSLLAALGTLWCVIDLGKRWWTRRVGLYAGWALLFALQFTYQAKKAQIDPLVVFWITLGNYGLLRYFITPHFMTAGSITAGSVTAGADPEPDWRLWTLGWFAAGLGTITKGVGVLALAMLLPAAYASMRGWRGVRFPLGNVFGMRMSGKNMPGQGRPGPSWLLWLGPLAFVLAIALWLLPMMLAALSNPDPAYRAYFNDILFHQTARRYAESWDHSQPWWYQFAVMATAWMPVVLALPWALPAWRRRLRRCDPRYLLPLVWWALVVVFFSIPSGKRDVYIMPALPMMCLALAPLLPGIVRNLWPRRIALVFALALAAAALGLGLAMLLGEPAFEARLAVERGFAAGSGPVAWLLVAIGLWGLGSVLWFGRRRAIAALLATLAGTWVLYGLVGYPLLNDSGSARGLMRKVAARLPAEAELGLVAWKEQNLLMALMQMPNRPPMTFGFVVPWKQQLARGLAWQRARPQQRWLFVQEPALSPCIDRSRAQRVGRANRRIWWLVPAGAVIAGCTTGVPAQAAGATLTQ